MVFNPARVIRRPRHVTQTPGYRKSGWEVKGVDEERCKGGLVEQEMRASLKVSVIDKTSRSRGERAGGGGGGGGCVQT